MDIWTGAVELPSLRKLFPIYGYSIDCEADEMSDEQARKRTVLCILHLLVLRRSHRHQNTMKYIDTIASAIYKNKVQESDVSLADLAT